MSVLNEFVLTGNVLRTLANALARFSQSYEQTLFQTVMLNCLFKVIWSLIMLAQKHYL